MAEEKNTVDYTIRNIPKDVDVTLSHLSILTGTPKSVIIRDKIIEMFTDQIKTFGMLSPLVDALDQVIAQHLGELRSSRNHWTTTTEQNGTSRCVSCSIFRVMTICSTFW